MSQPLTFEEVIAFLRNYDDLSLCNASDALVVIKTLAHVGAKLRSSPPDQLSLVLAEWLDDRERKHLETLAQVANQRNSEEIVKTISLEDYFPQSSPVRGRRNPELMNFAFWKFMIRNQWSAYEARKVFEKRYQASVKDAKVSHKRKKQSQFIISNSVTFFQHDNAGWTFQRFGMSQTRLPNGQIVYIAGEHEDYYNPDFFIYNDVIVIHPNLQITIYGYPTDLFPPTDFHSATLVGESIYIIGSLGYKIDRMTNETPVYRLNCQNFQIERVETTGEKPGWIHRHTAEYNEEEQTIHIRGGELYMERDGSEQFEDNDKRYKLDLITREWQREVDRP